MEWLDLFQDPKRMGLMVLIALGAVIAGKMVYNVWPKTQNPTFWGSAVAIGALAYMGVPEAAIVVWIFIAIGVVLGLGALVL